MATNATINVTANTSAAERAVEALFKKDYNLNVNVKGGQPLGRITGDLTEFNKSMEAANARVIAFGASASVVMGIQKAFHALIDSTIEVQKAFNQIQVVINANDKEMNKFGASLFNVAKQTGQSFETVAEAATLLSRQGLGMEETLKRTNDALILSRITGMDAAKSVQALTAAINSFTNQAVTATEVVNKFATVDTQFAIGAKDLPEAIGRVGSSAAQAGVSLDQLIALVTAAQVATARGGAVIGNSFKTIFTRLDRPKTQDLLESLGISTTDASGKVKGTIELLQDLARVYDTLSRPQQAQVAEKVGGVFQINILKATLADLNKEYSVYNRALQVSAGATDDAYKRNEALNQTYAAQLNALKLNATQFAASTGDKLFGPALSRLVGAGNTVLGAVNEADANSYGAKLANGILSGLGQFLAGPGLGLIGGVLIKLFADFSKYIGVGAKELLGLNTAAKEQADLQKSVVEILSKDPSIYKQIESGAMSVNEVTKATIANLKLQTAELELQAKLSAEIAAKAYGGGVRVVGGVARTTKADGYIPNFVSDEEMEEAQARMLGARNPRAMESKGTIGGKKFILNSEEDEIPNFGNNGDSAVIPRYAGGWVPNFASASELEARERRKLNNASRREKAEQRKNAGPTIDLGFTRAISLIYAQKAGLSDAYGIWENPKTLQKYRLGFHKAGLGLPVEPDEANLEKRVIGSFINETNNYIETLGGTSKISDISKFANTGAIYGMLGNIFETAVTYATGMQSISRVGGEVAGIDFPQPNERLRNLFHKAPGQYEAKYNDGQKLADDVAKKAITAGLVTMPKGRAAGYIPNFANALHESIAREIGAGAPKSGIYVKQYSDLTNSDNPLGLGVFNSRDEGSYSREKTAMRKKGYAAGYIPNFADDTGSVASTVGAVSSEIVGMALMLAASNKNLKEAYNQELTNRRSAIDQLLTESNEEITKLTQTRNEAIANERAYTDLLKGARDQELILLKENFGKESIERKKLITELANNVRAQQDANAKLKEAAAEIQNPSATTKAGIVATVSAQSIAMAASILAPIIANTIVSSMKTGTQGERVGVAAVKGAGDIASYAATGFMIGGPGGAVAGGIAGVASAINGILKELNTKLPEYQKRASDYSQGTTKQKNDFENIQKLAEQYNTLRGENKPQNIPKIQELRSDLDEAISKYSGGISQKVLNSLVTGGPSAFKAATEEENKAITARKLTGNELNTNQAIIEAEEKNRLGFSQGSFAPGTANIINKIMAYGPTGGFVPQMQLTQKYNEKGESEISKVITQGFETYASRGSQYGTVATSEEKISKLTKELSTIQSTGKLSNQFKELLPENIDSKNLVGITKQVEQKLKQRIETLQAILDQELEGAKTEKEANARRQAYAKVLEEYSNYIVSGIKSVQVAIPQATETAKFGMNFSQQRGETMESFLKQTGFSGEAENLGIKNTIYGTRMKAQVEGSADIQQAIQQAMTENLAKGLPNNGNGSLRDMNERNKALAAVGGPGQNFFTEMLATTATSFPTKTVRTSAEGRPIEQFDTAKIIQMVQNTRSFQQSYGGDINSKEARDAIDKVSSTIEKANAQLINAERELATAAAKKIDDLIKTTIDSFVKFGGGINQLLDKQKPNKAGEDVEEAVKKLTLTENSKGATSVDIAGASLTAIQATSKLMGGMQVFSADSPLFRNLVSGTAESAQKNFNTAMNAFENRGEEGSKERAQGKEIAYAMRDAIYKNTGFTPDRKEAFEKIAQFQAAQATGGLAAANNTDYGQVLYKQQVETTLNRLRQQEGGGELVKAYESASKFGLDPTTNAVLDLRNTYERIASEQLDALKSLSGYTAKEAPKEQNIPKPKPIPQGAEETENEKTKSTSGGISNTFNITVGSADQKNLVASKIPGFEKDVTDVVKKHFGNTLVIAENAGKKDASLNGPPKVYT